MKRKLTFISIVLLFITSNFAQTGDTNYLEWNSKQLENVGKLFRQKAKVGSNFRIRGLNTDRVINYKLRATLMSSEMIRASARFAQLRDRLTDDETKALVKEAENAAHLVVMIELDPNEGSGVIPLDWRVFLQPKGLGNDGNGAISGIKSPQFKAITGLSSVFERKYDYDLFMVAFPLVDENNRPLISPDVNEIEVVVGIGKSEGSVSWVMPDSLRTKIRTLTSTDKREEKKNEN